MAGHLEHSQTHDEASAGITPFPRPSPHKLVTNQERDKRCNGVRCARLVAGPGPPLYSASCAVTIHTRTYAVLGRRMNEVRPRRRR